jgi:septation ring formation regulator EzrA|tara:strand:+ start:393 stop:665 length:273 start_codon:yes stop_codon:yes gene_type:complete
MSTKKLDKVDIDSIVELRAKYAENTNTIGLISTDEYVIKQQLEHIQQEKDKVFNALNLLREEENKLMDSLKEKYGDGQINIEEGTFTPVS